MFALGINYLNGWAMAAADGARKELAEWPPHPDRVFMALAAAWFESGDDQAEGTALRWLETLGPPSVVASEYKTRSPYVSYVPVNDSNVSRRPPSRQDLRRLRDAGLSLLPEHRSRQPRGFPVAIPYKPTVYMVWESAQLGEHRGRFRVRSGQGYAYWAFGVARTNVVAGMMMKSLIRHGYQLKASQPNG